MGLPHRRRLTTEIMFLRKYSFRCHKRCGLVCRYHSLSSGPASRPWKTGFLCQAALAACSEMMLYTHRVVGLNYCAEEYYCPRTPSIEWQWYAQVPPPC